MLSLFSPRRRAYGQLRRAKWLAPLSQLSTCVLIGRTRGRTRPMCGPTSNPQPAFCKEKIMSKVAYIPKGYNTITPYLVVKGASQAIDYYKKVFGATEVFRMDTPDGKVAHAELQIGDSRVMLSDENPKMGQGYASAATIGSSPVSLYVYLPDVDKVVDRALAAGAKILKPVQD